MAYTVRRIPELSTQVQDRPGLIADLTAGSARAGVYLNGVIGYSLPGDRAVIVGITYDVDKVSAAARAIGWAVERTEALVVEGDYELGLLHTLTERLRAAKVNILRTSAHAIKGQFHAWFTVAPEDLDKAEAALK